MCFKPSLNLNVKNMFKRNEIKFEMKWVNQSYNTNQQSDFNDINDKN